MADLLQRLRERKLVQWSLAYVAAAFALIQVLDVVAQRFGWPEPVERWLIVALATGFFVALVLAWYHGERGVQRVTGTELLILALLFGIGGVVAWRFAARGGDEPARAAAGVTPAAASAAAAADPHSIAVLPFVNMSGDKDNDYFSDGVSEEILNVLAGIPALRVAARTSSFSFREGRHEAPEIARELHVRLLLEGSVRKQGDRARITAQLIDAGNGFHLWSQTYDRELKDIFAIQDEIAAAIANELKVKIGAAELAPKKARNPQAHDLYLRGLAQWQARGEASLFAAIDSFKAAIAADAQFAEAYAGLAMTYAILPDWSARLSYGEALDLARENAELALTLDPALADPYLVLGYLEDGDRRRTTAQALYRRAVALRPSFATAYQWLGNSLFAAGDIDGGLALHERASALDPRSAIIANNHGIVLIAAGRNDEAIALCAPTLKQAPRDQPCLESTAFAQLLSGDYAAAHASYRTYAQVINPAGAALVDAVFDALEGKGDRRAAAERLAGFGLQSSYDSQSGNVFSTFSIPPLLVLLGEPRLVVRNLDAFAMTDRSGQTEWSIMMKALGPVHCDPAFVDLVRRVRTRDPHHDALCATAASGTAAGAADDEAKARAGR